MVRLSFVFGTRPEIIKLSPLIALCKERGVDFQLIHTGQHYSDNMDEIFFRELDLPKPDYNLRVGSKSHGAQTALMLAQLEKLFIEKDPGVVVVQGDTNSVLAGALAAAKMHIPVAHVEAGLRSYDKKMPEELNRIITDHISTYLFAPTNNSRELLMKETIQAEIHVSGNTIVDAVHRNLKIAQRKSDILEKIKLPKYSLMTLHRAENVDHESVLRGIMKGIEELGEPIIWPIHPRTKKRLEEFKIPVPQNVQIIEPLGYLDFLMLQSKAELILTDSGGLQEEACILGVPCVTIRTSTERPETIEAGSNKLAGVKAEDIVKAAKAIKGYSGWRNPLGDGKTSERILNLLSSN